MSGNEGTLKQQLKNLRVADLKHIATSCNLRVHGKKADLIDRLCESAVAPLVIMHLQQMSRGEFTPLGWRNNASEGIANPISQKKRRLDALYQPPEPNCLCKGLPTGATLSSSPLSIIKCPRCQLRYHDRCVGLYIDVTEGYEVAGEAPVTFLCPKCRLKDLDPFHTVKQVLYCISLFDDPQDTTTQKVLPLRSPNIQILRRKGGEVFIMCLKLDGAKCALVHEWPYALTATINKNVEKIKKPEYEHKRRDVPMKITPYLFGNTTTANEIKIEAEQDPSQPGEEQWAIAMVLCSTESVESIEANVLAKARLPYGVAKALTMNNIDKFFGKKPQPISVEGGEALSDDDDEEDDDDEVDIIDTSCKVKLLDPITLSRLQVPVRGKHCKHLQCYDLHSYLIVTKNAKSYANRWKCVVCNQATRPKDLIIDSFIESLLQQSSAEAEAVVFDSTGKWEEVKVKWNIDDEEILDDTDPAENAPKQAPEISAVAPIEIDDEDDDVDEDDDIQTIEPPGSNRQEEPTAPPPTPPAAPQPPVEEPPIQQEVAAALLQLSQQQQQQHREEASVAATPPPPIAELRNSPPIDYDIVSRYSVPPTAPAPPANHYVPSYPPLHVVYGGNNSAPGFNVSPVTQSSASPSPLYDYRSVAYEPPPPPPPPPPPQLPMIYEPYGAQPSYINNNPQHFPQPPGTSRVPRHVDMTFGNWQGGLQQGAPPR